MPLSQVSSRWASFAPHFHALLRIVSGFMFTLAGTSKLFAFPVGMPPDNSVATVGTQVWFGGVLETIGGLLIMIGLCTRPVAFLLAGEMAVAYFQFHYPRSFWPTVNGGVSAVLYCWIFFWMSAAGAGPWSVDAMRRKT